MLRIFAAQPTHARIMADQDSGDKTEKPTDKRLRDARKKGDIPKSKELTSTFTLLIWLGLFTAAAPLAVRRVADLALQVIASIGQPFSYSAPAMGWLAMEAVLWIAAMLLLPVMLVGLAVEFVQAGPIFTLEKIKPKLENLNPVQGVKKMFSMNNLIEVLKAALKTLLLLAIGWFALRSLLPDILQLMGATPSAMGTALFQVTAKLLGWTLAAFFLVSVLDIAWQRHNFTKKMRMSMSDIKKEMKESEGDPLIKAQRKQAHHEWSQQGAAQSAAKANVLVVNPTHVAIAIDYDRETCPVPTLSAKGEDGTALAMREAAQQAGVPIVRNIALARDMLVRAEVGEIIPQDLFETMAEVILWARQVRDDIQAHDDPMHSGSHTTASPARRAAPGEDLTRYPEGFARD
jgi:type III secretion protein U